MLQPTAIKSAKEHNYNREYLGTISWESYEGLEQYAVYTDNFPVSEPQMTHLICTKDT